MPAPTISPLPALPSFPSGPGLPDQPGVFIPLFLAFLTALGIFRTEANALAAYLEGLGGSSGGSAAPRWAVSNTSANTRTLGASDVYAHLRFNNAVSAELAIPLAGSHGFVSGDCIRATQIGAGQVVITAALPTITINSLAGLTSAGPGAVFELTYVGTNEWDAFGDLLSNAILASGDMTDGDDQILLSGDMTDGDDIEMTSGV